MPKTRKVERNLQYKLTDCDPSVLADLRFAQLLTRPVWEKLPAAIRKRFGKCLGPGQSVVYRGHLVETRMNRFGTCLAQFLRVIGAPLPLECGEARSAAVVTVTEAPGGGSQFWTRQYNRKNSFPQIIQSTKSFSGPTGLEECIGKGIGMTLTLKTNETSLFFCSDQYFVDILNWRFYLPKWMTPGKLTVAHRDLGRGEFNFSLTLYHPIFGELLHQVAKFRGA